MAKLWGRGTLAGLLVACSGVDAPLLGSESGGGSPSVYLHGGSSACGSAGGGATAASGSASLPSDFVAGTSGTGAEQGGQTTAGGAPSAVLARGLVFSEYVEGSSTYKALEITALTDSSLEGCRVALYFNGGTSASGSELEGTLLAGESHVICSSSLSEVIGGCDESVGLTFNGDDAIALECDGVVIDVIGQIGFDPGTTWGTGDLALVDHTLRRRCEVELGDIDPFDVFEPSGQWLGFARDSFDDLGSRSCAEPGSAGAGGGAPIEPSPELGRSLVFTEYVEGSSTYKALEITALDDSSLDGCRVALYFNGGTTPNGSELSGTLLAGDSYVICSSSLSELGGSCDRSAGLTFNGDDAIALECDGMTVDVIGQIGFDPGTAWGSGELSLLDHTLRRSCVVERGDSDFSDAFEPSGEWLGFAQDSFEDLGIRDCLATGAGGVGG
ncbi:MAG TPA: hypothetical protein VM686_39075 [Polyangiaceae bacterium]|nr:hypothetical protein [Polyangiaceae bacterium]